jgi:hypothetical protein
MTPTRTTASRSHSGRCEALRLPVLIVAVVTLAGGLGYVTGDSSDDNDRGAQLWEALVTGNLSPQVACGRTCRPPTGTLARATECRSGASLPARSQHPLPRSLHGALLWSASLALRGRSRASRSPGSRAGVPSVMARLWHMAQPARGVATMLDRIRRPSSPLRSTSMETRWHHRRSATRPAYFLGRPTSLWIHATRPNARRDDDRSAKAAS